MCKHCDGHIDKKYRGGIFQKKKAKKEVAG